jgi:hypothetical protein
MFIAKRGIFPVIVESRDEGTSPLCVLFDASDTTAPGLTGFPFHELHYEWDFGDPSAGSWTYYVRNDDKNKAYGPIAAHVFENDTASPVVYTVTLTVRTADNSYSAQETVGITVTPADTTYAGALTTVVSTSGVFTGKPAGATEVTSSDADATANNASYCGAGKRLLFKRGETFDVSALISSQITGTGGMIGAWGAGADPIFRATHASGELILFSVGGTDWRICDIEVDVNGKSVDLMDTNSNCNHFLLKGMTSVGHVDGVSVSTGTTELNNYRYFVENDFDGDNTCTYQYFGGSGSKHAFLGNRFYGINSAAGGHNMRISRANRSVVANNYVAKGKSTGVVCRLNGTSEYVVYTDNYIRTHTAAEALVFGATDTAGTALTAGPQNDDSQEYVTNLIYDANYIQSVTQAGLMYSGSGQYITFRNNIFNAAGYTGGAKMCSIAYGTTGSVSHLKPRFWWIYNNSINLEQGTSSNAVYGITLGSSNATNQTPPDIYFYNNIICGPNASGAQPYRKFESAGTFTTESNNTTTLQMTGTDAADIWVNTSGNWNTPEDFKLKAGSYAIDAGTSVPVYNDAAGVVRTGTMDMGAYAYVP